MAAEEEAWLKGSVVEAGEARIAPRCVTCSLRSGRSCRLPGGDIPGVGGGRRSRVGEDDDDGWREAVLRREEEKAVVEEWL